MTNCIIYLSPTISTIEETIAKIKDIAVQQDINLYILQEQKEYSSEFIILPKRIKIDCILVFGGDGTILRAVKHALKLKIPILGINLGHLGFLSEIYLSELANSIRAIKKGKYKILSRMMLKVVLKKKDKSIINGLALNDVVLSKGDLPKLINLKVYADRNYVFSTRCDGVIVASPTGSTAYSLSAGGPIISPVMDAMVVVPITPHVLTVRPIVFPAQSNITLKIEEETQQNWLQLDGQNFAQVDPGDQVKITSADQKVDFIKLSNRTFFKTLRTKMHLGKK